MHNKLRAPRNRTLTLSQGDEAALMRQVQCWNKPQHVDDVIDAIVCQDIQAALPFLPRRPFIDLLFLDPPYNLDKAFNGRRFKRTDDGSYTAWLDEILAGIIPALAPTASIYVCTTWESSGAVGELLGSHFAIRNRITWEREKGRGAARNWKNASEDIWFCTVSDTYTFDVDAVKLKKRVIAPYTDKAGDAKDWQAESGQRYRLTHPSNLWTDLTVPFWSMPENTDHPTQKPEKLLAKLILASSRPGDLVFDPFLGSGTAAVVARKLGRRFLGIEVDSTYCMLALKRLELATHDSAIQGYSDGLFWERNSDPSARRRAVERGRRASGEHDDA